MMCNRMLDDALDNCNSNVVASSNPSSEHA